MTPLLRPAMGSYVSIVLTKPHAKASSWLGRVPGTLRSNLKGMLLETLCHHSKGSVFDALSLTCIYFAHDMSMACAPSAACAPPMASDSIQKQRTSMSVTARDARQKPAVAWVYTVP